MAEQAAAAARQAGTPLASFSAGDARDLPIADDSADAVLLLGISQNFVAIARTPAGN